MDNSGEDDDLCIKISDISLLDCSICFNALTIPIFQCLNGHVTCSSCHARLKSNLSKCPTCSTPLGNSRNRALEKLLESLKLPCSYKPAGCSAQLPYSSKRIHEEICAFAPFKCPFKHCIYSGSPPELYSHLHQNHSTEVIRLKPDGSSGGRFERTKAGECIVFLQEEGAGNGSIYVLDYKTMRVRRIGDQNAVVRQRFTIAVKHNCGTFLFEPDTVKTTTQVSGDDGSVAQELIQFLDQFCDNEGFIWVRVLN